MSTCTRIPSLVKKYLMAVTGLVLALFVLGHMIGNLQIFLGPEAINAYAYHLHNLPGKPFSLWAIRAVLLLCLVVHVWMAVLLVKENRRARPDSYRVKKSEVASYAARTMPVTGVLILGFIVFHILQYTTRVAPEDYNQTIGNVVIDLGHGITAPGFDVFAMMIKGFSSPLISIFYIVIMALLCMHLSHGFASMFQSVGLRNESWRYKLVALAKVYGFVVFIGFISIPIAVLAGYGKGYLAEKQAEWAAQAQQTEQVEVISEGSIVVETAPASQQGSK